MTQPFLKYDIGGAYHWKWYLTNYEDYQDFTNSLVALIPEPGRLLDVGCGDGLISYLFFRSGFDVTGCDTSSTAIQLARMVCEKAIKEAMGADIASVTGAPFVAGTSEQARSRFDSGLLTFQEASIYELPETDIFDYAVCSEVIEHVEYPEQLLKVVHRAIRKFAIITTPNSLLADGSIEAPGPYDYHSWSPTTFEELLWGYDYEFIDIREGTISIKLYAS